MSALLKINEKIWLKLISTTNPDRKLFLHRSVVLILTFFAYSVYHMSRKPMSVVKSKLYQVNTTSPENWPPFDGPNGRSILSVMDGIYWGSYAFFMFITGFVAERSNLRYFLSISLTICGIFCIIFGLAKPLNIHSLAFFIIMQALVGAIQTTGWPTVVAIIGAWFANTKKGLIMGIWNLHTNFGNILGLLIAGAFVDYNWGLSFMVPGFICIGMALISFILIIPKPSNIGIQIDQGSTEEIDVNNRKGDNDDDEEEEEQAITFLNALRIPGVIEFAICLAFTKSVSYIFLNWLPKYLEENDHFSSSSSAFVSIMFDVGGMIGSIVAGFLADWTNSSGLTCIVFLILAIPSLLLFDLFSHISITMNFLLQFITGFFINGPYALITTAVSANLADKVPSQSAMATVSAIIDGTGSIGAAIGPAITGPMADHFGWKSIFYMSMALDFLALLCLIRVGYGEFKNLKNRR